MSTCILHGTWGDYCGPDCARLTRAHQRRPFKFEGRENGRYYWSRPMPGDSRVEQVSCDVEWFWGKR